MPTSLPSWNTAALAVVGRAARSHGARRLAGATEVAGLAAAGLSLVQCVLGLLLAGRVATGGDSSAAGSIFEPVSRIDGAKVLLLAVVAVSAIALARPAGALPAWTVYPTACWRSY